MARSPSWTSLAWLLAKHKTATAVIGCLATAAYSGVAAAILFGEFRFRRSAFHVALIFRGLVRVARRYGATGALLLLDLDNSKTVNDTLGHKAGDELLVAAADALRARLRDSDVVARLGGDEFAVANSSMGPLRVSASIGVAAVGSGGATAEELLVHADLAKYDAKQHGRDGVAVHEPESDARARAASRQAPVPAQRALAT